MKNFLNCILLSLGIISIFTFSACDGTSPPDDEAVVLAAQSLTASNISFSNDEDSTDSVTDNFTLPLFGKHGTSISWESPNTDLVSIAPDGDGTVTRPSLGPAGTAVTLTATISKGEESETKEITITIQCLQGRVTYNVGIGNTGGSVQYDPSSYNYNDTVQVRTYGALLSGPVIQDNIMQRFLEWNTKADGTGTSYSPGDTFQITEETTLYALYTSDSSVIGKIGPARGYVFYDAGTVQSWGRYMEVTRSLIGYAEWGVTEQHLNDTGTAIGDGPANTAAIVAWLDANTDDTFDDVTEKTDRAAYQCYTSEYYGFDDWFLPSRDELNAIYTNIVSAGLVSYVERTYWSSSEYFDKWVWTQDFPGGSQASTHSKFEFGLGVVSARAF